MQSGVLRQSQLHQSLHTAACQIVNNTKCATCQYYGKQHNQPAPAKMIAITIKDHEDKNCFLDNRSPLINSSVGQREGTSLQLVGAWTQTCLLDVVFKVTMLPTFCMLIFRSTWTLMRHWRQSKFWLSNGKRQSSHSKILSLWQCMVGASPQQSLLSTLELWIRLSSLLELESTTTMVILKELSSKWLCIWLGLWCSMQWYYLARCGWCNNFLAAIFLQKNHVPNLVSGLCPSDVFAKYSQMGGKEDHVLHACLGMSSLWMEKSNQWWQEATLLEALVHSLSCWKLWSIHCVSLGVSKNMQAQFTCYWIQRQVTSLPNNMLYLMTGLQWWQLMWMPSQIWIQCIEANCLATQGVSFHWTETMIWC